MLSYHLALVPAFNPLGSAIALFWGALLGALVFKIASRYPVILQRAIDNAVAQAKNEVLPHTDSFNYLYPASRCAHCLRTLSAREVLPVISWIRLRGRCQKCHQPIGKLSLATEILFGIITALVVWFAGITLIGISMLLFIGIGITMAIVDGNTGELPDGGSFTLMGSGLFLSLHSVFVSSSEAILAMIFLYLFSAAVSRGYAHLTGRDGIGLGDCKLLAAAGSWFGASAIAAFIFASAGAVVWGVIKKQSEVRFGPFFISSAIVLMFVMALTKFSLWELL
jgi:leader peptidase (prepilin peptidase)/N-methyltransferase